MRVLSVFFSFFLAFSFAKDCNNIKKSTSKLFCYYSKLTNIDDCYCTHIILPANSDLKSVEKIRETIKGGKILITANEFNQGLIDLLKANKVDGLEVKLNKLTSKNDINDFISTVKTKLGSDLYVALSVPPSPEYLAKYYNFKELSKYTDVFILQTAFMGVSKNVTFHPSRLSGLWDMQNSDSMVDLVKGLGAPLSKLVITAPVQAFHFTLQNKEYFAPGSPALEVKSLTRDQFCDEMKNTVNWTMERDEDQAGPYIFSENKWIAFEDTSSIDIKAKYSRIRGLAGLALKDLSQDGGIKCGKSILEDAFYSFSKQARAPRGALLHTFEREIQEKPINLFEGVNVSPYRITRIIDVEGHWHVVRQDTRTQFSCSRQGYFVHPRSCNRFYRCVKFDQLSDEYSVFEFDCPAGLAFDERVEVCVWPGSLPKGQPCSGSSEIAPVPKQRFVCPNEPGYYADQENCRWFFACLDHGKSALEAYEFRCPFGLVFDAEHLMCEWPWLVTRCNHNVDGATNFATGYHYEGPSENLYSTIAFDHYDGLGSLGAVKFYGSTGQIQQPQIYSNVGLGSFSNIKLGSYNNVQLDKLGNQAAEAWHNAGLWKPSIFGQNIESNHESIIGQAPNTDFEYNLHKDNAEYISLAPVSGVTSVQNNFNINKYSDSTSNSYTHFNKKSYLTNNAFVVTTANDKGSYVGEDDVRHNLNTVQIVPLNSKVFEEKEKTKNQFIGSVIDYSKSNNNIQTYQTHDTGISENINVVGGSYSAVLKSSPPIEVDSLTHFGPTTHVPLDVSTFPSVSIVTSVPIPVIKQKIDFEQYNDGVIANFPNLQYKIQGETALTNITSNFNNFIASTIPTVSKAETFEYKTSPILKDISAKPYTVIHEVLKDNTHFNYKPSSTHNYNSQRYTGNGGYEYPQPKTVFEEGQSLLYKNDDYLNIQPIFNANPIIEQKKVIQPIVSNEQKYDSGYVYPKPNIPFKPIHSQQYASNGGYEYPQPKIVFEERSSLLSNEQKYSSGYVHSEPNIRLEGTQEISHTDDLTKQQKIINQPSLPFSYTKQTSYNDFNYNIPFEESPVVPIYSKTKIQPVLPLKPLQSILSVQQKEIVVPAVSSQQENGYYYPKPDIPFEEYPQILSNPTSSTIIEEKNPAVSVHPIIPDRSTITTYPYVPSSTIEPHIQTELHHTVNNVPIKSFYNETSTVKPYICVTPIIAPLEPHSPKLISKFTIRNSLLQQNHMKSSAVFENSNKDVHIGYFERPSIQFNEKPELITFNQQNIVHTTSHTPDQPAWNPKFKSTQLPVTTYAYKDVLEKVTEKSFTPFISPYSSVTEYPLLQEKIIVKPTIASTVVFHNIETSTIIPENRDINIYTNTQRLSENVIYPKITTYSPITDNLFQHQIVKIKSTTSTPSIFHNIGTITSKPEISSFNYDIISQQNSKINQEQRIGYHYPKPDVIFNEEPESIIKTYEKKPVEEVPFIKKTSYLTSQKHETEKQVVPKGPIIVEDYTAPFLIKNDYEYQKNINSETKANFRNDKSNSVSSTLYSDNLPTVQTNAQFITDTSNVFGSKLSGTSKTIEGYSYIKPDINFKEEPAIAKINLPVDAKNYYTITSTTSRPIVRYSFSSLDKNYEYNSKQTPTMIQTQHTTTNYPFQERQYSENYLPIKPIPTVVSVDTSTLSRDYLPIRTEAKLENIKVTTNRPHKIVKIVKPIKTVIKQNDFIPLLSTKLGAQCTCTSNTINLRKKQKIITIEDEDDDDGYQVENYSQGTIIENYSYEPEVITEISNLPQKNIKSFTKQIIVPNTNYIKPNLNQIELKTNLQHDAEIINRENESPSDKEIVHAVRTGLKLIKQAAKEGAKEGTEEVINKYNSRIRETIECQRAGLFRHPSRCNKFYSCKWDCTKNKYILHTFNCPIHLTFDNSLGACNWPSQGPACTDNTLLPAA